jgi:magnesium chelatase family protein
MLSHVRTAALWGLEALPVECEVDVGPGLPGFVLVGLPDASGREARDRVWPALRNAGFQLPDRKVTVNLAPAERRKEGSSADLAVALGVLVATGQAPPGRLGDAAALGEIALDGRLRGVRGTLPLAEALWRTGVATLLCAGDSAPEAALVEGLTVHAVATLHEAVGWLRGEELPRQRAAAPDPETGVALDLAEVRGQATARRALEIAAAGGHHLLLVGPPGAGKSMLARRLPGVLPPLEPDEALVVTRLHSAAGLRRPGRGLMTRRPFRAPHHSVTVAGLVGGGSPPHPGEISLAHRGVLFLDELPEFGQRSLEVLRQPIEDKIVTISRANGSFTFPANFMLIGAMKPCPCGYYGDKLRACTCSQSVITNYQKRISGPLLDRIDIHLHVPRVDYQKLSSQRTGEPSSQIRMRVEAARQQQLARFSGTRLASNADMTPKEIRNYCQVAPDGEALIKAAMRQLKLTARGYHRVLKLARTIADLAGDPDIRSEHLAEALQYRQTEEE